MLGEDFGEGDFPKIGHTKDVLARVHARQVRVYSLYDRANCHSVVDDCILITCNGFSQMLERFSVGQQFVPECDLELVSMDPEIVEFAANGNDVTFWVIAFVRGRELGHDAVSSNDLKYAQVFNDAGRSGKDSLFINPSTAYLRVRRPERDKVRVKVVIHVRSGVAANRR